MNGAESIVRTLLACDANVCFANPGTSEMHFVAALDKIPGMRCVLGLFEGVVTGAADGYGRMADKPAVTLLHLGPGLGNGIANLHNAKRACTPMVNIVGDHATYHKQYDAPLTSDVEGTARPYSHWVRTTSNARMAAADTAAAVAAARTAPGGIATLILPANAAWDEAGEPAAPLHIAARRQVEQRALVEAARLIKSGKRVGLIMGGPGLRAKGLEMAGRIAARYKVRILAGSAPSRIERGAGRVAFEAIPYVIDLALAFLAEFDHLILVGGERPVAFFAYPNKPSVLVPPECTVHVLAQPDEDIERALEWLADETGCRTQEPARVAFTPPALPTGKPTPEALAQSITALLPENAIVVDEAVSTGLRFAGYLRNGRPHDVLKNVGGAIGFGLAASVGAAIACPDRKILSLEADGSAMYTVQALWTQAREKLNITTVIFANRTYALLKNELKNVGVTVPGPQALAMLDIGGPDLDWCGIGRSMGIESNRAADMETFNKLLAVALATNGPSLIEVVL